jgi:hypothetical protein
MESFFKTLKYEEVYLCEYETFEDVVTRLPYVNRQRKWHSFRAKINGHIRGLDKLSSTQ